MKPYAIIPAVLSLLTACTAEQKPMTDHEPSPKSTSASASQPLPEGLDKITFGAGCFWCTEAFFERLEGVKDVRSGYLGGHVPNPTYKQVCTGLTGHNEVSELVFDPSVVTLKELMDVFWRMHDPTTLNRQGNDIGTQYRSGVYYHTEDQKQVIEASMEAHQPYFSRKIVTEVLPAGTFYVAEDYHQDYFENNPNQPYCQMIEYKIREFDKKHGDIAPETYKKQD